LFALLLALAEAKPLDIDVLTPNSTIPSKGVVVITQSTEVAAAPQFVQPYLQDLNTWPTWTSWSKDRDPGATWSFAGDVGKTGHSMTWDGKVLMTGRLALTAVNDNAGIAYDTWSGHSKDPSKGRITVTASEVGSKVEWQDVTQWGFPASLFFPAKKLDEMVSADFVVGLGKLKVLAEADAARAAAEAARIAAEEAARKAAEEAAAKAAAEEAARKAAEEAAAKAAEEAAAKSKKKKR